MAAEKQLVILKGTKNGIAIQLDGTANFIRIGEALRKKVTDAREFFAGANTNVTFKGRALSEDEEKSLLDIIFSETTLDVSFVASEDFSPTQVPVPVFKEETEEENAQEQEPVPVRSVRQEDYNTRFCRHSLRSGQSIVFDGSVVVLGDANAGSEIIAQGNVVVLGALRGMVHAGAGGDTSCFVSALGLIPTQLRIANIITSVQHERAGGRKYRHPEYAYIQNGQVYISSLMKNEFQRGRIDE